jgi:hypothetical protein
MADPLKIILDTSGMDDLLKQIEGDIPAMIIEDGVEYGIIQEFTDAGHPSLIPAFERNTKDLPKMIEQSLAGKASLIDVMKVVAFNIQRDWAGDVSVDTGAYKNSIHVREE